MIVTSDTPGHDEESEGDQNISSENIQPDLHRQGVHEAEETSGFTTGNLEEDGDAEVHEGLGEVNHALPGKVDGHGSHCNISFVLHQLLTR